jgi:hypothetical protein
MAPFGGADVFCTSRKDRKELRGHDIDLAKLEYDVLEARPSVRYGAQTALQKGRQLRRCPVDVWDFSQVGRSRVQNGGCHVGEGDLVGVGGGYLSACEQHHDVSRMRRLHGA